MYNPHETKTLPPQCFTLLCDIEDANGKHGICYADIPTPTINYEKLRHEIALLGFKLLSFSII